MERINGPRQWIDHRILKSATAIAGLLGLVGAVCLIAAVQLRSWRMVSRPVFRALMNTHDALSIFQSLLFIPAGIVISAFAFRRSASLRSAGATATVLALIAIALLQTLYLTGQAQESLYMIPQGVVGIWLICVNVSRDAWAPRWVKRLGMLAGLGLILIGISLTMIVVYFGVDALSGTIRSADPRGQLVNRVAHLIVTPATWLGKIPYAVWMLTMARRVNQL
jgi:hypothetical protein